VFKLTSCGVVEYGWRGPEVFRNNRGPLHERLVTALEAQRIINQNERSMMYKKA